nr:MAG TPA: hypothetical protein [Caudoviricetes sp.]
MARTDTDRVTGGGALAPCSCSCSCLGPSQGHHLFTAFKPIVCLSRRQNRKCLEFVQRSFSRYGHGQNRKCPSRTSSKNVLDFVLSMTVFSSLL